MILKEAMQEETEGVKGNFEARKDVEPDDQTRRGKERQMAVPGRRETKGVTG